MKIEAIKAEIVENYKQLSHLAHVKPEKENIVPTWGLSYRKNRTSGFVNQIGVIERGRSTICITDGGKIQLQKKPFFMTWKMVLKNMNTMLQNTIESINNKDVVTKNIVNLLCFSEDAAKRLSKLAKH